MEEGEEIILKVHRHWLFIAVRIVGLLAMSFLPLAVSGVLVWMGIIAPIVASLSSLIVVWALWGLILWAVFWQFWTTYYMDIWVVTNKRIIDIDYQRLFDRNISIIRLERVQDVATHIQGVIGTVLRFGSVIVQSAGTEKEFVIDQIANPEALRDVISKYAGVVARS